MNGLKVTSFVALLLLPCLSVWAEPDGDRIAEIEDVVIAQINDEIVTRRDIERELKMDRRYRGQRISISDRKGLENLRKIRKETLDRLIERRLLLQELHRGKLKLRKSDRKDVKKILDDRIKEAGDLSTFKNWLRQFGMTYEKHKKQIEESVLIRRLIGQNVGPEFYEANFYRSPSEVRKYYDSNIDDYRISGHIDIRHIWIRPNDLGRDQARELAETIRGLFLSGKDFGELAQKYSHGPKGAKGGKWRITSPDQLIDDRVGKVPYEVAEGKVSAVVESAKGFHLIYVEKIVKETARSFDDVQDKIQRLLRKRAWTAAVDRWMIKLRKKAFVKTFEEDL